MIAFIINTSSMYAHYFNEEYFSKNIIEKAIFYYFEQDGEETELAKNAIEEGATIIIVGGSDANTHRVLQEIIGKNITLGILPMTYSNTVGYYLCIEKNNASFVKMINDKYTKDVDLIKVESSTFNIKYGLNIFAIGYSAQTSSRLRKKDKEVVPLFWKKLILQINKTTNVEVDCNFHYHKLSGSFFEICILNTGFHSGNILMMDQASPFDGELDIVLVKEKPSIFDFVIFCYSRFIKSKKLPLQYVDFHKADRVKFNTGQNIPVHIDSVTYTASDPIEVSVQKAAQQIIVPENFFNKN